MLVEPGDTVTIAVDDYDPFIEDPDFEGVRKGVPPSDTRSETPAPVEAETDAGDVPAAAESDGVIVEEGNTPPEESATGVDTTSVAGS